MKLDQISYIFLPTYQPTLPQGKATAFSRSWDRNDLLDHTKGTASQSN